MALPLQNCNNVFLNLLVTLIPETKSIILNGFPHVSHLARETLDFKRMHVQVVWHNHSSTRSKRIKKPISQINPLQYQYTQSSFLLPSAVMLHNTQLRYLYFLLWTWTQPRPVFAIIFFFILFIPLCYYTQTNTLPIKHTWYFKSYMFQLLQISHYQCVQIDVGNSTQPWDSVLVFGKNLHHCLIF